MPTLQAVYKGEECEVKQTVELGTAPLCSAAECSSLPGDGWFESRTFDTGCWSGTKRTCERRMCKPACSDGTVETQTHWLGTAPSCAATEDDCAKTIGPDWYPTGKTSASGDGKTCVTGHKVQCARYKCEEWRCSGHPQARKIKLWLGTAPACAAHPGDCKKVLGSEWEWTGNSSHHDLQGGKDCVTGEKVECEKMVCPPEAADKRLIEYQVRWLGTAPACEASAEQCSNLGKDWFFTGTRDPKGNGKECVTGYKVQCARWWKNDWAGYQDVIR